MFGSYIIFFLIKYLYSKIQLFVCSVTQVVEVHHLQPSMCAQKGYSNHSVDFVCLSVSHELIFRDY